MGQANSLGFWASLVGQAHTEKSAHSQINWASGYPRASIVLGWVVGNELSIDIFVREMLGCGL